MRLLVLLVQRIQRTRRLPLRLDRAVELWENIGRLVERAERVNLDRKQVVLHAFTALESAAKP